MKDKEIRCIASDGNNLYIGYQDLDILSMRVDSQWRPMCRAEKIHIEEDSSFEICKMQAGLNSLFVLLRPRDNPTAPGRLLMGDETGKFFRFKDDVRDFSVASTGSELYVGFCVGDEVTISKKSNNNWLCNDLLQFEEPFNNLLVTTTYAIVSTDHCIHYILWSGNKQSTNQSNLGVFRGNSRDVIVLAVGSQDFSALSFVSVPNIVTVQRSPQPTFKKMPKGVESTEKISASYDDHGIRLFVHDQSVIQSVSISGIVGVSVMMKHLVFADNLHKRILIAIPK